MINPKVPLAIFGFNRPTHLRRVLNALVNCEKFNEIEVHIFIDGPKSLSEVKKIANSQTVAKSFSNKFGAELHFSKENKGLANSLISGVSKILNLNDKIIVLEDDILPSKYFIEFMLSGLHKFELEKSVASIHGYVPPFKKEINAPFFRRGADCWGWASWSDRWFSVEWNAEILLEEIEKYGLSKIFNLDNLYCFTCMLKRQINGEINSWAIRWHASMFLQNKLTLYPNKSLVSNFGFDGSGIHGGRNTSYQTSTTNERISILDIEIIESKDGIQKFKEHYKSTFRVTYTARVYRRFLRLKSRYKHRKD